MGARRLDKPEPRRWLLNAGFDRFIDAGIGGDVDTYLDILVQTFRSQQDAAEASLKSQCARSSRAPPTSSLPPTRQQQALPPQTHGVATSTRRTRGRRLVCRRHCCLPCAADVLRALNGAAEDLAVVNLDLRDPLHVAVASNTAPSAPGNTGYTRAR